MLNPSRSYLLPVVLALSLHAVLGYLLAGSWFDEHALHRVEPLRHVQAQLVDLSSQTKAKQESEKARQQIEAKKKTAAAEKKAAEQRRAEQQKRDKALAEKKRKAESERKVQAAEKKKKAEAKRQADIARMKEAEQRAKAKKEADLAAERKAKAKAEAQAEAERQLERERLEEARRRADGARLQREAEAEMQRLEQQRLAAEAAVARVAEEKRLVASALDVIRDGVQRNWSRPPSVRNGMEVSVRILLLPTGEVDEAVVIKSSGDDAFDRSTVNAVMKAERFPELQGMDPVVFDRNLRQITLNFRPEDLRL